MNPKVSVIVPVFNVQDYLGECLESIANQTYQNLEVILVDDGSSDLSGKICDDFVAGKENARVIHQKNMGLSGARNSGFSVSTGEYITFVDSDDVLADDYVESLVSAIINDADVVAAGMMKFTKQLPNNPKTEAAPVQLSNEEALKILCNQSKFGNSACAKLYKRYLVEKHPYPVGKLHEDLATTHKIIGDARGICYCPRVAYYYRQRGSSIINHTGLTQKDWYALEAAKQQCEYISRLYPGASSAAKGRCVVAGFDLLKTIRSGSKEDKANYKAILELIKPFRKDTMRSTDVNKKTKIKCVAISLGYYPAIWCSLMFERARRIVNG